MVEGSPLLEAVNITKIFPPGIVANNRVSLRIYGGEIHALLGENGAGKSTLARILYGEVKPDEGEILLEGRKVEIRSPRDALNLGIGMVHQHFRLVESLTVAENIALLVAQHRLRPMRGIRERIEELSANYGLNVDCDSYAWQLSASEKQRVEILKMLATGARVLLLDEPTSLLSPTESRKLLSILGRIKSEGRAVLLITHRLEEAMASDRITILRRGVVVGSFKPGGITKRELAKMMVGEEVETGSPLRAGLDGRERRELLVVEDLWVKNDRGVYALRGFSLRVYEGEVLGVAGEVGNGQRELVEAVVGLRRVERGSIRIMGVDVTNKPVGKISRLGVAYIPEDKIRQGLVSDLSVVENFMLTKYREAKYHRGLFLDFNVAREELRGVIEKYGIVVSSLSAPARTLSGGNMQKLIVARELSRGGKLIVASYPTHGLDVRSSEIVRAALIEKLSSGAGILWVSEDLEELLRVSDRIAVINRGRIVAVFKPGQLSSEEIGIMMSSDEVADKHALVSG